MLQVGKWGNSLAARLPASVVELLGHQEGDEIEISGLRDCRASKDRHREAALVKLKALAWKSPIS